VEEDEEVTPAEPAVERRVEAHRRAAAEFAEDDEFLTPDPAEAATVAAEREQSPVLPPPRNADSSEPPPRAAGSGALPSVTSERAALSSQQLRPSHKPFDSMRAKEQLSARAGRYRASSYPDQLRDPVPRTSRPVVVPSAGNAAEVRRAILDAWERVHCGFHPLGVNLFSGGAKSKWGL